VHFPVDSAAGHLLGTTLAAYFVARCTSDPGGSGALPYTPRRFRGDLFDGTQDFDPDEALDPPAPGVPNAPPMPQHIETLPDVDTVRRSPILAWMWKNARNEWDGTSYSGSHI
jgi:hypothetical protein